LEEPIEEEKNAVVRAKGAKGIKHCKHFYKHCVRCREDGFVHRGFPIQSTKLTGMPQEDMVIIETRCEAREQPGSTERESSYEPPNEDLKE